MTHTLKALIFDVDGTLANTERDGHRIAFNQAFRDYGLDWNWSTELYGKLLKIGGGKERIQAYIQHHLSSGSNNPQNWGTIQQLHACKNKYYLQLLKQGKIPLRPGVKRLIYDAWQAGLKLAIATTSSHCNAVTLIEETLGQEVLSWFSVIAAGDIVANKKPAPDIYHYVLEHLNLEPESCLVFEDSEQGTRAAIAANLKVIMTINDYTAQDFQALSPNEYPIMTINHLGEPETPFEVLSEELNPSQRFLDVELCQTLFI